jgi:hypothetical protein
MPRKPIIRHRAGKHPKRIIQAVAIQHGQKRQRFIIGGSLAELRQQSAPSVFAWRLCANGGECCRACVFHHAPPVSIARNWRS